MAVLASFLGAFLLFALQPLVGKSLLPIYGGGAGPWIACMLFFQLVLLGGYAYAHGLARKLGTPAAWRIHGGLALASVAVLALGFRTGAAPWTPPAGTGAGTLYPPLAILITLTASAGVPLLMLASTSPLIQAAYASLHPDRNPYRLYAVSNAGSLGGLLTYPFLVEPFVDLRVQAWSIAFLFLAYLGLLFTLLARVRPVVAEAAPEGTSTPADITWRDRCKWIGLSALGTLWLCSVTNQISTDVASVPLLWIPPLAAYLLTFILVFETRWNFDAPWWRAGLIALVGILAWVEGAPFLYKALVRARGHGSFWLLDPLYYQVMWINEHLPLAVILCILGGAAGCLIAHARLGALRPASSRLTEYYLFLSAGGALGGLFVSVGGPILFNQDLELYLALAFTGGLVVFSFSESKGLSKWPGIAFGTFAAGFAAFTLLMAVGGGNVFNGRDFFGSFHVEMLHPKIKGLTHGNTIHGIQFVDEPLRHTGYYGEESGMGVVLNTLKLERPKLRVGLVGLGVGNTAAFGRSGDEYDFFEISPGIIDVAGTRGTQFAILKTSPATVRVFQGDGRLLVSSQAKAGGLYDIILIDAFAGGHIPAHLLTLEALRGYIAALKPDGVLVLHVSHNLPLDRQAGANLKAAGLTGLLLPHGAVMGRSRSGNHLLVESPSIYWVTSADPGRVLRPEFMRVAKRAVLQPGTVPPVAEVGRMAAALDQETIDIYPWTDQRASLSPLLLFALRRGWAGDE